MIIKCFLADTIYGSRGANGVILITSKMGTTKKPAISYNGYFSVQNLSNLPDIMDGGEFYRFKQVRDAAAISMFETERYESRDWTYWPDLAFRTGFAHQHNLSLSGTTDKTNYYIAAGIFDVHGVAINDDYIETKFRINFDAKITKWISFGTRTQLTYRDLSGQSPDMENVFNSNPLGEAYDSNGNLVINPVPYETTLANPLAPTLYDDNDKAYLVHLNNFIDIDLPFIAGLKYRLNSAVRMDYRDKLTYRDKNTLAGSDVNGSSSSTNSKSIKNIVENILSYNNEVGDHNISGTLLYSAESTINAATIINASRYPSDILKWYAIGQAEYISPGYSYGKSSLISQMIRLNYSYNSRYLVTLTGRRDGYSGFGVKKKWGFFPSAAIGWNIHNEEGFTWKNLFSQLKLRASYGLNGNQAVDSYETIARMTSLNTVSLKETVPGYIPSTLAQDNLGWESSKTMNVGIDFGLLNNKVQGDINIYKTKTYDLLLNRTISLVHGIGSITQNIGRTENRGFELSINSINVSKSKFKWLTTGNFSYNKNKILSLYGELDETGQEIDDLSNKWFIGQPIRVIFDYKWAGIWQSDEADEATLYGQQPGFVRVEDINNDDVIDENDRQILGKMDPEILWGLTNSFSYRNFTLNLYMHGVHGLIKQNPLKTDHALAEVRINRTFKDWWTPDHTDAKWITNNYYAEYQGGNRMNYYENASFIRVKDISLSYDFNKDIIGKYGFRQLRVYITGRNLMTLTKYEGLDPELDEQRAIPLQREYVIGLQLGF